MADKNSKKKADENSLKTADENSLKMADQKRRQYKAITPHYSIMDEIF